MALPEYERLAQRPASPRPPLSTNLPIVEESEASGEVAALYDHFRANFGRPDVPGILKCFATHPPLLRHMMALSERMIFTDGALTRQHKEMIATLVSSLNACSYCADSHGYFLLVHGGTSESLCALQQSDLESPALTAPEQALLHFVRKVSLYSHQIHPADIAELTHSGWSELQISEAVHITALFATYNRVVNAFGLPSQGLLSLYEDQTAASTSTVTHGSAD